MPEGFPEHRNIVIFQAESNDVLDADSLGICALETIRQIQGVATTFALAAKKALVPFAWSQLIPYERGDAARLADRKPLWLVAAGNALPPISGHEGSFQTLSEREDLCKAVFRPAR